MKFCPLCGRNVYELHNGLCKHCFLKKFKIIEIIHPRIELSFCKCGRVTEKKQWKNIDTLYGLIEELVKKNIKNQHKAQLFIDYERFDIHKKAVIPLTVQCTLNIGKEKVVETKKMELVVKSSSCDICSRISGGYYEAILQLRGPEDKIKRLEQYIIKKISKLLKEDRFSFITKIDRKKEGVDLYIGSKPAANKIIAGAKKIYKLTTNKSHKLCGVKEGRKVYKTTILLRVD